MVQFLKWFTAAAVAMLTLPVCASERIEIRGGRLSGPGAMRAVRLHATGDFQAATVRVNGIAAGELANSGAELDITGYLSQASENTLQLTPRHGSIESVWAWLSPLIYIDKASVSGRTLVLSVVNTTENTAQIEVGEHGFTVAAGTSTVRTLEWPTGEPRIRIKAVTDGLDREFVDEYEADSVERH